MPLGYEECDIKVYIDYPQERQNPDGPFIFATDGTQIDSGSLVDCIIDPATLSVFGKPLPMTPEWKTTYTGAYARLQKSDFSFTSGDTEWSYNNVQNAGDTYIYSISPIALTQASSIYTNEVFKRNTPLFFSFSKLDKKSSSKDPLFKLTWSPSINKLYDVQLHFLQDGGCDVYRGYQLLPGKITATTSSSTVTGVGTRFQDPVFGVNIGDVVYNARGFNVGTVLSIASDTSLTLTGNATYAADGNYFILKNPLKVQTYSRTESNYSQGRPITTVANPNDQYNDVYIIPCRGRDLMVLTSFGLNFSHTFSDIGSSEFFPDPPNNITDYYETGSTRVPYILPPAQLKINILSGKMAFQVAKLNFKTNWTCYSQEITTPTFAPPQYAPRTGLISFNNWINPTIITGSGTDFLTDVNDEDLISAYILGSDTSSFILIGQVKTKISDTELELYDPVKYQKENTFYILNPRETGTISAATNDSFITGVGTLFQTNNLLGQKLYLSDGTYIGRVKNVVSETSLELYFPCSFAFGSALFYKNLSEWAPIALNNNQLERFGNFNPAVGSPEITVEIVNDRYQTGAFDGLNKKFRLKITQTNNSTDTANNGQMFYSADYMLNVFNVLTANYEIDITSALESLNIKRTESGELSLDFTARKIILEDLGVINPQLISNRSIKVAMQPKRYINTGTISKAASDVLTGTDTVFTEELAIGEAIYDIDGNYIGRIYSIESDTSATLFAYEPTEYVNSQWSVNPIYEEFIIFDGYLDSPDINYLQSGPGSTTYEDYALLSFTAIDKKAKLNLSYFSVAPNFDSIELTSSIRFAIAMAGQAKNDINSTNLVYSPSISAYQVPLNRNNSNGQYNFAINLGETSGSYIEKVRSDFAQNYTFLARGRWNANGVSQKGYNNSTTFELQDLDYVQYSNPSYDNVSLYLNETQAFDYGLIPVWASYKRTIRNLRKTYETPEANRIIITGLDKSDGSKIDAILDNSPSQNANTLPQNRNLDWLGDIYPFVLINDKLNSYSDVLQVAEQYYQRLTPGREIIEFDSDFLTYFDNDFFYIPRSGPNLLSGTITTVDGFTTVNGTGTFFTTELSVGDYLYTDSGKKIGVIVTISNNTQLDLINEATESLTDVLYNNYTQYLEQYNYIDIGDTVTFVDQDNVETIYKIIDWDFTSIREHVDAPFTTANIRTCKYRAKKVTVPNQRPLIVDTNYIEPSLNTKLIGYNQTLDVRVYLVNYDPALTYTATLSNNPTGMTIGFVVGNGAYAQALWTCGSTQQNKVFEDITITISDGTTSKSYVFTAVTSGTA